MKQCAFLSMDSLDNFENYDHLLVEPLASLGWEVDTVSWQDTNVRWNEYDVVIIRSAWDYQQDPKRFMSVLEKINRSKARLANSLRLVHWNITKTYLKDLQDKGISIVPTSWKSKFKNDDLSSCFSAFETDNIIIKPVVSANADDTFLVKKSKESDFVQLLKQAFSDRPFMIQPFMQNIIKEGEFSLFYFGDTYSHTVLKTPKIGDFRVQEEHGAALKHIEPERDLLSSAQKAIRALPEAPLYARIDFVRTARNSFALMEAELIEPSLYFNMDPKSPQSFVKAFDAWING